MKKCSISCFLVSIIFSCVHGQSTTTTNDGVYSGTGGLVNSFYGYNSGRDTTGNNNSFFGAYSGYFNESGQGNTFIGNNAGSENWEGNYNTYIGKSSGTLAGDASYNSAVGVNSGLENYGGSYNVFFGANSGSNNQSGSYNTCLGINSGYNNGYGNRNVFIGSYAGYYETGSDKLYIDNSNTSSPLIYGDFLSNTLRVNGTGRFTSDLTIGNNLTVEGNYTYLGDGPSGDYKSLNIGVLEVLALESNHAALNFGDLGALDIPVYFKQYDSPRITLATNGKVGVGTTTPDEMLTVNGIIHTKEVRVDLSGWPDYVFNINYTLPKLKEVEQHIREKGHLKDIPSAKEVEENGILLGDMNAKLLQKIEELTLYIIQQDKEIKVQQDKNASLEERLGKLETLFENIAKN
jgi:hypothetical protein